MFTQKKPIRHGWREVRTIIQEGTLSIEEAGGDVWVGSASASRGTRGDMLLAASFGATVLARDVVARFDRGIGTPYTMHRGWCDRLPDYLQQTAQADQKQEVLTDKEGEGLTAELKAQRTGFQRVDPQQARTGGDQDTGMERVLPATEGLPPASRDEVMAAYRHMAEDGSISHFQDPACMTLRFWEWRRENPGDPPQLSMLSPAFHKYDDVF